MQIEKIASEKLGRQVSVGSIDFKPWSLELTLDDLLVAKASGKAGGKAGGNAGPAAALATGGAPQLSLKRIYTDAELESLLRLAPVVDAIAVDSPSVPLAHLGGERYDIDDVLNKLKSPPDPAPSEPPRFALYNLALTNGQVGFTGQTVGKTHALSALNVSVPFLNNLASWREVKTAPRLAFKLGVLGGAATSSFDFAFEATPFAQTRKTDAAFKLTNFDLKPYLG